jgi:glutathione synthase/RimK-type ligase-like ATP-grasp enzyme
MKRCAFLTLDDPADYVIDDELAVAPLAALGWRVESLPWRQRARPWSDFDAVVIRSPWDYHHAPAEFLAVLGEIERSGARLANPLALVRWNLEKTYLRELAARGVQVVPTVWRDRLRPGGLARLFDAVGGDEIVVKPTIGATAEGAFRLDRAAVRTHAEQIERYYARRPLLAQPFQRAVLDEGESSLFYFNGRLSHAVVKTPKPADFRVQEDHGGEIRAVRAGTALRRAGRRVLRALGEATLYARVDLVRSGDANDFLLMELELIEPALYLRMDPGAPARFARALDRYFTGRDGEAA